MAPNTFCALGPGVRKRNKTVKEAKKKPKPKKTKLKSGQSGKKKKKASSVSFIILFRAHSDVSTALYFHWHQTVSAHTLALILFLSIWDLSIVCPFPEWRRLPGRVRLWWYQYPQCLCIFRYFRGPDQEKNLSWEEKKEKYVYCLHSPCFFPIDFS